MGSAVGVSFVGGRVTQQCTADSVQHVEPHPNMISWESVGVGRSPNYQDSGYCLKLFFLTKDVKNDFVCVCVCLNCLIKDECPSC